MSLKILVVFGTRPEAIKMAPLVLALKADAAFDCKVCVTGQHRQMLDQVLHVFDIVPDHDLNIMQTGQDLYDVTSRVLLGMREVLDKETPDWVLVHGDTHIDLEKAQIMAQTTDRAWNAIMASNTKEWGKATREFLDAQLKMFPRMLTPEISDAIESYRNTAYGWKIAGCGSGGYLVQLSVKPITNAIKVAPCTL